MPFVRQVVEGGGHGTVAKRSQGFDSSPVEAKSEGNHVTENRKQQVGGALIEHVEVAPTTKKEPKQPSKQDLLDNFASIFAVVSLFILPILLKRYYIEMTDAQQIYNLEHDVHRVPKQYLSANWNYLQDVQNGQYSNQIAFNTTSTKANLTDLHNGFITIPMALSSGGAAWPTTRQFGDPGTKQTGQTGGPIQQPPNVAFKQSVLDLIGNLQIATDNGSVILNETNTNMINNLRLLLEHDENWFFANSDRIGAWPDQFDDFHSATGNAASFPGKNIIGVSNMTQYQAGNSAPTTGSFVTSTYVAVEPITNDAQPWVRNFAIPVSGTQNGGDYEMPKIISNAATFTTTGQPMTLALNVMDGTTGFPCPVISDQNINYNKGFGKRIMILKNTLQNPGFNYAYGAGTHEYNNTVTYRGWNTAAGAGAADLGNYISYIAVIPLKLLHDFFMQMNFPIINWGLVITLYLNQTPGASGLSQASYTPFMTDNSVNNTTNDTVPGNTVATGAVVINYANASITSSASTAVTINTPYSTCRLWYRSVQLEGSENKAFSEALLKGYKKRFKFISCDVVRSRNQGGTGTGNTGNLQSYQAGNQASVLNETITTSIVQPIRCWVLMTPTGHYQRSDYAAGVCPGRLQDVQVQIANLNYFPTPINPQDVSPEQWWTLWKEQQDPAHPSMINYSHFINTHNYMCLDVSRLSNRLPSATLPVTVQIQATRADRNPYAVDVWYLFERWNEISIDFSNNGVNIVVGNVTTGA